VFYKEDPERICWQHDEEHASWTTNDLNAAYAKGRADAYAELGYTLP